MPSPEAPSRVPVLAWWRAWAVQHLAWRIWFSHALAVLAALACVRLGTPLPWLIGPLLVTASLSVMGWRGRSTYSLRNVGQWSIGTALGLYFTPQVMAVLLAHAWAIAVGIAWAVAIGLLFAAVLYRLHPTGGPDAPATAFFAGAIGGASEMTLLAQRHKGRGDLVAAAHSVRVLLVVVIIPFGFQFAGVKGLDTLPPAASTVHAGGLSVLVALTIVGALLARRVRSPNPALLGPLAVTLLLTAGGLELSALPTWVINTGQVFIGVSLGAQFSREFLHGAPRWLAASVLGTLVLMVACAAFAWVLARFTGLHPLVVLLGTSPGGIAEMCLTAKALQIGVPVVTAFHVTRMVAIVLLADPLFRWMQWRWGAGEAVG